MPDPLANTQQRLDELETENSQLKASVRQLEDAQLTQGKFTTREALKVAALTVAIAVPLVSICSGLIMFALNSKVLHDPVTLENRLTKLEAQAAPSQP